MVDNVAFQGGGEVRGLVEKNVDCAAFHLFLEQSELRQVEEAGSFEVKFPDKDFWLAAKGVSRIFGKGEGSVDQGHGAAHATFVGVEGDVVGHG